MNISLLDFLKTGRLGQLQVGMPPQRVRDLLGEPDAVGGTSRKYPRPTIYLYGTVELFFSVRSPYLLTGIYWEAGVKGGLRLPDHCTVEDWPLMPGASAESVMAYLRDNDLTFTRLPDGPVNGLKLQSGVQISFDEDRQLYALYSRE